MVRQGVAYSGKVGLAETSQSSSHDSTVKAPFEDRQLRRVEQVGVRRGQGDEILADPQWHEASGRKVRKR